jgi:hypothetical protein
MSARPPEGATFEISRIERTRSPAPIAALLWIVALVGIVAVGAFGRGPDRPEAAAVAASDPPQGEAPGNDASTSQPFAALGTDLALVDAIDLRLPAIGPITLNEAKLTVFGKVIVHAALVEISVEARNNRVIDSIDVDVSDPDGGIRPAQQAQFEAQFPLPYPRPNGTMWVVVTAYDALGLPLGGERRPFLVGAIIQPHLRILDLRDN